MLVLHFTQLVVPLILVGLFAGLNPGSIQVSCKTPIDFIGSGSYPQCFMYHMPGNNMKGLHARKTNPTLYRWLDSNPLLPSFCWVVSCWAFISLICLVSSDPPISDQLMAEALSKFAWSWPSPCLSVCASCLSPLCSCQWFQLQSRLVTVATAYDLCPRMDFAFCHCFMWLLDDWTQTCSLMCNGFVLLASLL